MQEIPTRPAPLQPRRRPAPVRPAAALALALGAAAALAVPAPAQLTDAPAATGSAAPAAPIVSIFAVGDTGSYEDRRDLAVAEAIAAEDRRAPAAALVLLGDNFYPHGLRHKELEARIARNVVRPWCRFAVLTAPRSAAVKDACELDEAARRPGVPIYAVLGNHDYEAPESPALQREVVPQYVANWRVPLRRAEVVELAGGVSLVLFDSTELWERNDGGDELARALRSSRGPWRIVAAHHPPIWVKRDEEEQLYRARLARALDASRVPVHLLVAGHEHNLQLVETDAPWPPLVVVAGSGSDLKDVETVESGLRYAAKLPGFARVDLVAEGGEERLVATLFTAPEYPLLPGGPERAVAWSVDRDGRTHPETSVAR
jgi:predicted phosphodiesterase